MQKKLSLCLIVLASSLLATACGGSSNQTANGNANGAATTATTTTTTTSTSTTTTEGMRTGPDNSEIRTETAGGVTTETRYFRDPNSKIERVVVTTREGKRTARVYYRDRTVRELPDNDAERALVATGDVIMAAGGKVVDVSKDVGSEVGDKAEDVKDQAGKGLREVGDKAEDVKDQSGKAAREVGDKAEDAKDQTVKGAKKVGSGVKEGAKKLGDAITP